MGARGLVFAHKKNEGSVVPSFPIVPVSFPELFRSSSSVVPTFPPFRGNGYDYESAHRMTLDHQAGER